MRIKSSAYVIHHYHYEEGGKYEKENIYYCRPKTRPKSPDKKRPDAKEDEDRRLRHAS